MMKEVLSTIRSLEQRLIKKVQNSTVDDIFENSMSLYNSTLMAKQLIENGFSENDVLHKLKKAGLSTLETVGVYQQAQSEFARDNDPFG